MSIVPTLFLGVEYCATFQAALYIETHSLMHQSEFHAAGVALSRAADKRKSLTLTNGYARSTAAQRSITRISNVVSYSVVALLVILYVQVILCAEFPRVT